MSVERLVTTVASGLFIAVLGALIKYYGMTSLIAGYDPETVADEEGLASYVGNLTVVVGGVTALVGVLDYQGIGDGVLWHLFVAFVVCAIALMGFGSNRFTH